MEQKLVDLLLRYRVVLSIFAIVLIAVTATGAKNLYMVSDYKAFFDKTDPMLVAHEAMQESYTKTDNLSYLIRTRQDDVFDPKVLAVIKELTDASWQTPYSIRVDSITNYQHSWADGDELIVEDLVSDIGALSQEELLRIKTIALTEKQLVNRLIARDGKTVLINVSLELPESAGEEVAEDIKAQQRIARDKSFGELVSYSRQVRSDILEKHPELEIHILGIPVINQSFNDIAVQDSSTILPLMYIVILVITAVFLRSVGSLFAVSIIIFSSTAIAMGGAGWLGFPLNNITLSAPVIVLAIAVCDCVHLLVIYIRNLALGEDRFNAMRESLTVNLQPIVLTSATTIVGFLTLNFSDSPHFRSLGNISAIGVAGAMFLTFALLPSISLLLIRKRKPMTQQELATTRFADFVISHRKSIFFVTLIVTATLIAQIPRNHIDDDPIGYFEPGVPYRDAADFSQTTLPGIKNIDFSISCGETGCINQPEFLAKLKAFSEWLEAQPDVEYVSSYIDVIKRLNKNMNANDENYYRIPDSQELAAQYQLLYEMSLPYGLDLNNQINFDKSASRVTVFMNRVTTAEFVALEARAEQWLAENYPEAVTRGSSVHMMFATLGERNIRSMGIGAIIAVFGVTLTILIALRSFKYAAISLIPNAFPAAMALGTWGLLIGTVNMAVALVFSITLGIVVDDTVHFISKYRRARELKGQTPEDAIRYAFSTVGAALFITTMVLAIGFGLLTLSDFNVNAYMGELTAMTIVIAVIFDFLMLPILLLFFDRKAIQKQV